MRDDNPYRLSRTVEPVHYDLFLHIDPDEDSFFGSETITVRVNDAISTLELNALDLTVSQVRVNGEQASVTVDPTHEIIQIQRATPLPSGAEAEVYLEFSGTLRSDLSGLYRSTYSDERGATHNMATTQFESTGAREAFPCFDEPDMKATFAITLETPAPLQAISNYPERESTPSSEEGFVKHSYETTMVMSTYLLAFIVGDLRMTAPIFAKGVPVRVIHAPGKESLTDFALRVANHAITYFEDWFQIPYPAPKLDLLAIPDFAFGAMENLGAVTFRETALLVDEARAGQTELERICDVVCHEIAHMWFGDLVTMKWWNGIWLNEAFATFMETSASDAFNPDWHKWESFGIARLGALNIDALPSTRPIEFPVVAPSDAENMFDPLTYEKGCSVIKMMEQYLGEETFKRGVRRYLNSHLHANAETEDLWSALEEVSDEPVTEMMNTWILQGGHPLVNVDALPSGVRLSQTPFRFLGEETDPIGEIGASWLVPVVSRELNGTEHRLVLGQQDQLINADSGPVIVNAGGIGVYRTRYSPQVLPELCEHFGDLQMLERFNLIADTWAMVLSNQATLADAVQLFGHCVTETDPNVLQVISSSLGLLQRIALPEERPLVVQLASTVFTPVIESIGMVPADTDTPRTRVARSVAFTALGTIADDPDVRSQAMQWFREEMSGVGGPSGDLASAVLATVARHGDDSEFAFMLDRYRNPVDPLDERRHLLALADFRQPSLINRLLPMVLTSIRSQDGALVLNRVIANEAVGELGLDFAFSHFDDLLSRLPANHYDLAFGSLPTLVSPTSYQRSAQIFSFFDTHKLPAGERLLTQTLERYRVNLRLRDRYAGRLNSFLS
ncbi:M1 family metallopeptidase [Ferrimicrobium sp.]|uniref:M1 family metallopeptidase n=1 Tax=Ferrimicrobium sp. TaxID=2926050 RepID=UPI002624FB53|nr:M1 family metallopeptidase [Ferrimicrobium sp.]